MYSLHNVLYFCVRFFVRLFFYALCLFLIATSFLVNKDESIEEEEEYSLKAWMQFTWYVLFNCYKIIDQHHIEYKVCVCAGLPVLTRRSTNLPRRNVHTVYIHLSTASSPLCNTWRSGSTSLQNIEMWTRQRCFAVSGPTLWKTLPPTVRELSLHDNHHHHNSLLAQLTYRSEHSVLCGVKDRAILHRL